MSKWEDVKVILPAGFRSKESAEKALSKFDSKFQINQDIENFDIHEFLKSWDDEEEEEEPPLAVTGNAIKFDSLSDVITYLSKEGD